MTDQLPPVVDRLIALNSTILLLAGMVTLANESPMGYVEVHQQDIRQIALVLQAYMHTLQAELDADEQQPVTVQDTRIVTAA